MSKTTGKAKAVVGWATGDRDVEAKGRAEERAADPADPTDEVTGETVAEEREQVREDHGD